MKRALTVAAVAVLLVVATGCDIAWLPTMSKTVTCTPAQQQVEIMLWNEQESWNGDEWMRVTDGNTFLPGTTFAPDGDGVPGGGDVHYVTFLFPRSDTGTYELWADIEWRTMNAGQPHHQQRLEYDLVLTGCP